MNSVQERCNQVLIDLSLYWPSLTVHEKELLISILNASGQHDLSSFVGLIKACQKRGPNFQSQFLPVAEAILARHLNVHFEGINRVQYELDELQRDYCVLYEINQRMAKRLDRFENKHAKRKAKQERVERFFAMRGRKPWQLEQEKKTTPIEIRLQQPLQAPRKHLVKGSPEYLDEKARLDQQLEDYQNEEKMFCQQHKAKTAGHGISITLSK